MSRVKNTIRNILFGYIGTIISLVLGFVSRTVFIYVLGATYLGINGLFTNILGVLSFAELGIGTAMNYSLYKPVAERDTEKIKSLMRFYKFAYRTIALIVTIIGLIILSNLKYIIKGAEGIDNIAIYYLIFLFNTVISYLVSYKFSLVNAEQKNYIFTNINTITSFITIIVQIISLIVFKNFLVYLLITAVIGVIQKMFISIYLNKKYPYLMDKDVQKLSKEELEPIKKNVGALIWHKIGEISVHQTDNIIISMFISVGTVGLISNYNLLMTSVSGFITIIFSSVTSSLGNLIATESKEKQYSIFKIYRFIAFWLYGFSAIAFYILMSPFIEIWLGKEMIISSFTILFIIINYYMMGHRICINNIKSAGGVFNQDKFVAILQAIVNLVVSIVMVKLIGLPGVYIGTLAQGTLSTVIKPIIVYRDMFDISAKEYFVDAIKFAGTVIISGSLCWLIQIYILNETTIIKFVIMMAIVAVIPNLIFYMTFSRREEFRYVKDMIKRKLSRRGADV